MPKEKDEAYDYDVFISYSHKDKAWVKEKLLPRLEEAGLKVCIDFRDFKPGRSSLLNMQDGARHSRRLLPVLTENWFTSEWSLFEGLMAGRKAPAGLAQRIVPVLLRQCDFPDDADFIAALTYVDFTDGADLGLAWRQLLTALGAPPELEVAPQPERVGWFLAHPYAMPPNFTGRADERALLSGWLHGGAQNAAISGWLNHDPAHPMLVLRALGGFGKSALTWQWLTHDVDPVHWPRAIWWSFYEGDASFESFVGKTLQYLSDGKVKVAGQITPEHVRALLTALEAPGILLVLDGFERLMRAFGGIGAAYQGDEIPHHEANERECISPLAEKFLRDVATLPGLKSKVLLTTRLRPHAVETRDGQLLSGCREEELLQMQPADAVEFFHAQGIRGTHTEIEAACAPYGYHPLSLRLLAGLITRDLQQPGDIAAAKRLDVSGDIIQRQHHVLELSYDSLTPTRQKLLGRIACFRSPVAYESLRALAAEEQAGAIGPPDSPAGRRRGLLQRVLSLFKQQQRAFTLSSVESLESDLRDLVARGLLHHDVKEGRFDLHPIVRRYAYDRLAAPDRAAAHTRLRDYFAAVPPADKVTRLEDLSPVIELYHHTVQAGRLDEAGDLFYDRLATPLYYQLGAYPLIIDLLRALFPEGGKHSASSRQAALPCLKHENSQAWALSALANAYSIIGQPSRAAPLLQQVNHIYENKNKIKISEHLAIGLVNVAALQLQIGSLRAAEDNLRRSIALCRRIENEFWTAVGSLNLAQLMACRGEYAEADSDLAIAKNLLEHLEKDPGIWLVFHNSIEIPLQKRCLVARCASMRALLLLRNAALRNSQNSQTYDLELALAPARRTLELADETAQKHFSFERDYVDAHWLLGAAHRVAGQSDEAGSHLYEALERCRRIGSVDAEADILIDLARLRVATSAPEEAQHFAEEALLITERCGYVLQGADAHLELAKLALTRGDKKSALHHATEARKLATCDGPPDYTYKVAYDEAGALLEQLK